MAGKDMFMSREEAEAMEIIAAKTGAGIRKAYRRIKAGMAGACIEPLSAKPGETAAQTKKRLRGGEKN